MRLKIRAVRLRVQSDAALCGADIILADGLVVLRAGNTSGKSTLVQSIIYALGLEGMLSASHDVPLPHVMTDSIVVGENESRVSASYVSVEIENAAGKIATILRGVNGPRSRNLVTVTDGASLSSVTVDLSQTDYYVREPGAAINERGFHRWLMGFTGWTLPQVGRIDGTDCPLYAECIFPLMIIEQKRGWSAIQARMPYYYRIRDVAKKSTEFLLALDVYDLARRRQKLREEANLLRTEWNRAVDRVIGQAGAINGVVQNLQTDVPRVWGIEEEPSVLVSRQRGWVSAAKSLRADIDELTALEETDVPQVEAAAQAIEANLADNESQLGKADFAAGELLNDIESDSRQLSGVNNRLSALEEDERRNGDLLKLQKLGSVQSIEMSHGICPTCHQEMTDALLPQDEVQRLMTVDENLKFIRSQIETFRAIREAALKSLTAKRRRMDALREQSSNLRAIIRAARQALVGEGNQLSVETIERRLRLREKVNVARRVDEQLAFEAKGLRDIGKRWRVNQDATDALPKGDLSERDQQKLRRLQEIFVSSVGQFGLSSVPPSSLRISEENYRPEHDGFNLEFDLSASDMIRTIWAYLHGLLELSRETPTNHLGLLILDEPRQQETARPSFKQLFRRASEGLKHKQQVIIATSEDETNLLPLLHDLPHQYISFDGLIINPIREAPIEQVDADPGLEEEMPWEIEARQAVESALSSMDFNYALNEISFMNYRGESVSVDSKDELENELREIAQEAWMSMVPVEDESPLYECDDSNIVSEALDEYESLINEFFSGEDDLLEP